MSKGKRNRAKAKSYKSGYSAPDFAELSDSGDPSFKLKLLTALSYANYTFDYKKQKRFLVKYCKENLPDIDSTIISDYDISNLGRICWLKLNDVDIDMEVYHERIVALHKKYYKEELEKEANKPLSTRTRSDSITSNLISEFEGLIDDVYFGKDISSQDVTPIEALRQTSTFNITQIEKNFKVQLEDMELYPDDYKDCEKERATIMFILNHIQAYKDENKQQKKADKKPKKKRVKKPKPPSKLVERLKYQKEDKELNLISMNPESIINASSAWIYNTKWRALIKYVADKDTDGLTVSGTTIKNIDLEASEGKKITEKELPKILENVKSCTKAQVRRFLEPLKTKSFEVNGRLNDNCIIVKTYK